MIKGQVLTQKKMNIKPLLPLLLFSGIVLTGCQKDGDTPQPDIVQKDIATIDAQIVQYMSTYKVPGASLAISKDGKLVYSKGYGFADQGSQEAVTVHHRFRIASISKTLTSIAIMNMMEESALSLDDKVFGEQGILGTTFGTKPYYPYLLKITVRDLLQHTGGGWRNFIDDPCFLHPDFTSEQLISWGLDNVALAYEPGTHFHYSNFGYLILGRIIEKLTGETYENYVKSILAPLGAIRTEIAGNKETDRKNEEVKYYTQNNEDPYASYAISRNDAPFGWISTPSDLLRVMTAIDGARTRPDLLSGETLAIMTTPAPNTANHAKGIYRYDDPQAGPIWFNYGSLPGTHTFVFRSESGFCVAFFTNSRFDANYNASSDAMSDILLEIIKDEEIPWQDMDQF